MTSMLEMPFDHLGFSKRHRIQTVGLKCVMAHGSLNTLQHDHCALNSGGAGGSRVTLPVVPVRGAAAESIPHRNQSRSAQI